MQKRILIIVESIDVEDSSGSKANVALIKNLSQLGYDLKVYHYTRKEVTIDEVPCVSIKENRRSLLFFLSRLERHIRYRLKLQLNKPLEKRFGFSFTLLNDRNSIVKGLQETKAWNPDLVITLSKGGSFRPHHALLKLPEFHDKWLAYIHDPYPMHFYPPPYPWFEPGYQQKEEFMKGVARKAKITGFPSQLLMEWMGGKFQPFYTKGIVIPHQLEETFEGKENIPEFFDTLQFNLVHAGNLLPGRDPKGLIEGFKKFLQKNPEATNEARLIFLGGASYYSAEIIKYRDTISQFIATEEYLSFNLVQKIQKNSTVNIILEAKSNISPFLPGKFPHCVLANRIILHLGPPKSEANRLLGPSYPFQAEIDDVNKIAELIGELYNKWKEDSQGLELNRTDLEEYLSKDHLKDVMREVFEKKNIDKISSY